MRVWRAGKSRLLIEAAKKKRKLKFVQTRLAQVDMAGLAELLREQAREGDIVVFEDCQEYVGDFAQLLTAVVQAKARVIAATRYLEGIEPALAKAHLQPAILKLEPMADAAQVVPETDRDVRRRIALIAQGSPAIAVMAYMHYRRTGSLKDIKDQFGLLKSVFEELFEAGNEAGFPDTREFLAEMAVRAGLWQDHAPMPGHEKLATRLRRETRLSERRSWATSG